VITKPHEPGGHTPRWAAEPEMMMMMIIIIIIITPYSTVLLEKLTGSQLVKKFPAFYGTRRFITAFARARHLSLSDISIPVR
jgi:hypothetical protein